MSATGPTPTRRDLIAVGCTSATLLMIELALTRIFSVVMYYHFAFLAISIALFGLSASGVFAYVMRRHLERHGTSTLLARTSIVYGLCALVALFFLVRLRVGLNYSPRNLALMLTIYALAALPFFAGGLVITIAISRLSSRINAVYAADLIGAAAGCVVLIPLLDRLGAPGVVLTAVALAAVAAVLFAVPGERLATALPGVVLIAAPLVLQFTGAVTFDVTDTKGHQGDRILFSKWNSFSRIGVYERQHGDWSLSDAYKGPLPESRFMDIDSAASTPILHVSKDLSDAQYLRYELTALAYQLREPPFSALVIGPGGGRDLVSAVVFGAARVEAVEINPIIANDVMRSRFSEYSGRIYDHPRVHVTVDDGRSFIRRTPDTYDVIQASLVDTWAATAAGAYTLTENTLYTVEAFDDYLDHLTDGGVLTITRWVFDGLRLVSLAQAACESRGWDAASRVAIVRHDQVATFLLKKTPFTAAEVERLRAIAQTLSFDVLYVPDASAKPQMNSSPDSEFNPSRKSESNSPSKAESKSSLKPESGSEPNPNPAVEATNEYARLILANDREDFYNRYPEDIRPTTDDRPFFFHTTKLRDQFQVAFGRSMLFGNGLSALLTLMGISALLVVLFVLGPLALAGRPPIRDWFPWIVYFGALGAGFMLLEVAVLQRFVLLLGHPVYSLTVTLFSLLLGTGAGAALSRRVRPARLTRSTALVLVTIVGVGLGFLLVVSPVIAWAIPFARPARIALAVAIIAPIGMILGVPMPAGIQLLRVRRPEMLTWAWGMNGAFSVVGATLAIFIAMNWGFQVTLFTSSATYLLALVALLVASR